MTEAGAHDRQATINGWKFSRLVICSLAAMVFSFGIMPFFGLVLNPLASQFVHSSDPAVRAFPLQGMFWDFVRWYFGPIAWVAVFIGAVVRFRWRGLWLLLEAPVVFFWLLFWLACAPDVCP
jgi:hypothetical protein